MSYQQVNSIDVKLSWRQFSLTFDIYETRHWTEVSDDRNEKGGFAAIQQYLMLFV